MPGDIINVPNLRRVAAVYALLLIAAASGFSQSPSGESTRRAEPVPTPQARPSPTPRPERHFFSDILRDQRAIWTSPFRLGRGDARWLAPLGITTAVLIASDQETGELGDNRRRISVSKDVSLGGSIYATGGIAAGFYLVGRAAGNERARETGLLAGEALVDSAIVDTVVKNISQRPRPTHDDAHAEFFDGGHSFPSGHAAEAWALATVVANEYHDRRAVQVAAYGLAAAVSVSRYTGRNHFLSDVLVGSALGYGIGRFVYKKHHDATGDASAGEAKSRALHSKWMPLVAPRFSRAERSYGLALAWGI
jgi:membrane-associated phospholipid phosphatase